MDFHPVGQGLFSSGTIYYQENEFKFIYDCGTSSSQSLIEDAIKHMKYSEKSSIDLLVISHFDNDHISGLDLLLEKFSIDTLLLPMIDLETRLILAFENSASIIGEKMKFYLDPIEYITSKYNDKIKNIILVPPSEGEPQESQNGETINERLGINADLDKSTKTVNGVSVDNLKVNGKVYIKGIFEFIPYNDSSLMKKLPTSLVNIIKKERNNIISMSGATNKYLKSMISIRDKYDKFFGKTAKKRNIISLFLFAGPILKTRKEYIAIYKSKSYMSSSIKYIHSLSEKDSFLYTGDGYLNSEIRLNSLINYLGLNRIQRIVCFQVMHHGAKGCWHKGTAKAISPLISVFSSNPDHKGLGHPHAEVVRDFLPFTPIQVDKDNHLSITIECW